MRDTSRRGKTYVRPGTIRITPLPVVGDRRKNEERTNEQFWNGSTFHVGKATRSRDVGVPTDLKKSSSSTVNLTSHALCTRCSRNLQVPASVRCASHGQSPTPLCLLTDTPRGVDRYLNVCHQPHITMCR